MADLTAQKLNERIVKMKPLIGQAKFRLSKKLIQKMSSLKAKKATEEQREKNERKSKRLYEELKALKRLEALQVAKFALINTKTLSELAISAETSVEERALFKLVTTKLIQDSMDEFREKFPKWHQEVPFMLQRLGKQYQNQKKKKTEEEEEEKKEDSAVQKLLKGTLKKEANKLKNMKNKGEGQRKHKILNSIAGDSGLIPREKLLQMPAPKVTEGRKGEGTIKKLSLDALGDDSGEESERELENTSELRQPSSSFFLGGESDEEEKERRKSEEGKRKFPVEKKVERGRKEGREQLHPSWAAKRKQSEQMKLANPGSAKKIKFQEDSD